MSRHPTPPGRQPPVTARQPPSATEASPLGPFGPRVLRDYAFLADGYRGALLGPMGNVSWLCAPIWDSPAVFAGLVGGRGCYAVTPAERSVWGGFYEPGTLIWRSRWTTPTARIECREALACPADSHRLILLRRLEAIDGIAVVDVLLDVSADFGRATSAVHEDGSGTWTVTSGRLSCRWTGATGANPDHRGVLRLRLRLQPGQHHSFILEISDRALPGPVPEEDLWLSTEEYWRRCVPRFEASAAPRDTRHAYAVLRGLTAPGGGMVAAATLGLPERARSGRNYDYRYVWLRDQAYAGLAVSVEHPDPLLDEAIAVTTARVLEHGDRLAPAYRLDGRLPPREEPLELPGYPGGHVTVGNWVRRQFQLDCCGELLALYAAAGRHDRLSSEDVRAVSTLVEVIAKRWETPDAGVWELADDWWTHSRLACVAGLRAAAAHRASADSARLVTLAEAILAATSARAVNADGTWRQAPGRPGVDAALLMAPVRGAVSPSDPRSIATLRAVTSQLVQDGYVYRYAVGGQPLGDAEGAFLLCGFVMCLAQLAAGNHVEAFRWFERQRAASGPAGLLAEEFDVRQRQLRGNLPQGFVHALLLECSIRLAKTHEGGAAA